MQAIRLLQLVENPTRLLGTPSKTVRGSKQADPWTRVGHEPHDPLPALRAVPEPLEQPVVAVEELVSLAVVVSGCVPLQCSPTILLEQGRDVGVLSHLQLSSWDLPSLNLGENVHARCGRARQLGWIWSGR